MVERGSDDGRILCTPWQLAQLATVSLPSFAASPWKEASKLTTRSAGRPKRRDNCTLPWQFPQVSRMLPAYTGEALLVGARMECSPWQSVQIGRLGDALGQRLAVDAGAELVGHLAVAHPASVRHLLAELCRLGPQQFVRGAVAYAAIRRGPVAALGGLPVDSAIVIRLLPLVALAAGRLGDVRRMRIFVVFHMAGSAGHVGVRALCQLGPLIVVAGRACRVVRRRAPAACKPRPAHNIRPAAATPDPPVRSSPCKQSVDLRLDPVSDLLQ